MNLSNIDFEKLAEHFDNEMIRVDEQLKDFHIQLDGIISADTIRTTFSQFGLNEDIHCRCAEALLDLGMTKWPRVLRFFIEFKKRPNGPVANNHGIYMSP